MGNLIRKLASGFRSAAACCSQQEPSAFDDPTQEQHTSRNDRRSNSRESRITSRSSRSGSDGSRSRSRQNGSGTANRSRESESHRKRSRRRGRSGEIDLRSSGPKDLVKDTFMAAAARYQAQSKAFGSGSSTSPPNLQPPPWRSSQEPLPAGLVHALPVSQGVAAPLVGLQVGNRSGLMPKASPSFQFSASASAPPPSFQFSAAAQAPSNLSRSPPLASDQLPCDQLSPIVVPALHPLGAPRPPPAGPSGITSAASSVQPCGDYRRGACTRGDNCKYSHGDIPTKGTREGCPLPFDGAIAVKEKSRPVVPLAQGQTGTALPYLGQPLPRPPPPPPPSAEHTQGHQIAIDSIGRGTDGRNEDKDHREMTATPPRTIPPIRLLPVTKYAPSRTKASSTSQGTEASSSNGAQDIAADELATCHSKSQPFTLETPPRPAAKVRPTTSKRPRPPSTPPPGYSAETPVAIEAGTQYQEEADSDTKRLKQESLRNGDSAQGGLAETLGRLRQELGTSQSSGSDGVMHDYLVDEVHFTQNSCRSTFRNGITLDSVIRGLNAGELNPLTTDWLHLEVVRKYSAVDRKWKLYSNDNRRLYCLKEHQRYLQKPVVIKVRVYDWPPALDRFWGRFDQTSDGKTIHVRHKHRG